MSHPHRHARALPHSPGEVRFSASKTLLLWGHLLPVLAFGAQTATPGLIAGSAALCAACLCLGHSVGLHRGLIHRSFSMGRATRFALCLLATLTGIGPVLRLMDLHDLRDQWQNRSECPAYYSYHHGALRDLWWVLHCAHQPQPGQERLPTPTAGRYQGAPALVTLDRLWWLPHLLLAPVLFGLGGWGGLVWGHCARVAMGVLGHWFVNFCAHRYGALDWSVAHSGEEGRNNALFGMISMGEGWHNNHHAFPHSARFGQVWWQADPGWWAICALRRLGLVWAVVEDTGAQPRPGAARLRVGGHG